MRKKFKLLFAAILTVVAVLSVCAFSACGSEIKVHECVFEEIVESQFLKTPATCTQRAVYYKSCECGERSNETFEYGDTLAHTYNWYPVIEDVEICKGHKFVQLCSVCKTQASGGEGDAYRYELAHSDKWTVESKPTLTETGLLAGICSDCEKKAEYVLPKLNKDSYSYSETEQDCYNNIAGEEVYAIEVDGQKFEFKVTVPIYHTLDGVKVYNDGLIKSYADYPNVKPLAGAELSCDERGTKCVYVCDKCKGSYDILVRKEHSRPADISKITIEYDSCVDDQRYYYDCPNCNDDVTKVKEVYPAIGHKFEYTLEVDDAEAHTWNVIGVCKNKVNGAECGEHDDVLAIADSLVDVKEAATCTKGAVRSYEYKGVECTYTETETLNHRYVDEKSDVDMRLKLASTGTVYDIATIPNIKLLGDTKNVKLCSEAGVSAIFTCADCGQLNTVLVKYPHTRPSITTDPVTGDLLIKHHDATCTEDESTVYVCTVCNEEVHEKGESKLGHIAKIEVISAPTLESAGSARITCERCDLDETIDLPALNKTDYNCETIVKQTCVSRGQDKYTYKYTGDLADAGLPELVFTVVTDSMSVHVNEDEPETIVVLIKGIKYRGYICANCHRFVITETLG